MNVRSLECIVYSLEGQASHPCGIIFKNNVDSRILTALRAFGWFTESLVHARELTNPNLQQCVNGLGYNNQKTVDFLLYLIRNAHYYLGVKHKRPLLN
jgi:hypothetical protein